MALRNVIAEFLVKVNSDKLVDLDKKIANAKSAMESFGMVLGASKFVRAYQDFIKDQIEIGTTLGRNAKMLGVTTDELQRFHLFAEQSGVSAESMDTGLRFLNKSIGEASYGSKRLNQTFGLLGVNIRDAEGNLRPTSEVFVELSDKFAGMKSEAQKTALAMRLFGRSGASLLPILDQGSEELQKTIELVQELGGGMEKEYVEAAKKANIATTRLNFAFQALKSRIATELIPGFIKTQERMQRGILVAIDYAKHTYAIRTAIIALVAAGGVALFLKMKEAMGIAGTSAKDLGTALLKFGGYLLIALALYLVWDELYTLWNGGNTIIGGVIDALFGAGTAVEIVKDLHEKWAAFLNWLDTGGTSILKGAFLIALASISTVVDTLITAFRQLGGVIGAAFKFVSGDLKGAAKSLKDAQELGAGLADRVGNRFNSKGIRNAVGLDVPIQISHNRAPFLGASGGAQKPSNFVETGDSAKPAAGPITVNNHITVPPGSNPKAFGDAVTKGTTNGIQGGADLRSARAGIGAGF